ncbi:hypothetical protein F4808DRAFT_1121 [Astrocystis sublimbata]|nr:hypothetical protein F4808DRAFT_1121 [Astrocystis sublimbata]
MGFQFIEASSIDKKTRTLIRSHAAKGKNLGRTIHRPSRHPRKPPASAAASLTSSNPPSDTDSHSCDNRELEPTLVVQRPIQEYLKSQLPFEISPACWRLFNQFVTFMNVVAYPVELRYTVVNVDGPRLFMQYAFIDEAFFHCVVALSVAAAGHLPVSSQETTEAFYHLARSLRLVNQRLAGDRDVALSDTTLGAVIIMTQHERLLGYHKQALVHFEGLQKIIALRGGMTQLTIDAPGIAQKVLRADFDFALQVGSPPRFNAACVLGTDTLDRLHEKQRVFRKCPPLALAFITSVNPALRRVYEDITTLAWLVNDNAIHGITVNDFDFHNLLLLVGYRLLKVRSWNSSEETTDKLEVLLHLGLAALMSMFFTTLGVKPVDVNLLRGRIFSALSTISSESREEQELALWLLLLGKSSVFKGEDENEWLVRKVSQTATRLGLSSWDHVSAILQRLPWVKLFSEQAAQSLWNLTCHRLHPHDNNSNFDMPLASQSILEAN